jgi:LacI family transcriptional regulator
MNAVDPQRPAAPRVLVVLQPGGAWSRGILRGFMSAAHERGWILLHYHPGTDLDWLMREFTPVAALIGPELAQESIARLAPASIVSVTLDRSEQGIASVCPDDEAIAALALNHLLATGLRQVSTFRFDESRFAIARERAFVERARASGIRVAAGWGSDEATPSRRDEDPAAVAAWLCDLPKPCGVFTISDGWGRTVARYAQITGLRVPEEVALIGADNDVLECELVAPPLSSVMVPWRELGRSAARLVEFGLSGQPIAGKLVVLPPVTVMARRSSATLAIDDPLVAKAVGWIRQNSDRGLTVPMVVRAMGGGRQRLERRFRLILQRTVREEIQRTRVDMAKSLLESSRASLLEVAKCTGFTTAALLSKAFHRELGMPPGLYRRRVKRALESTVEE